MGKSSKIVSQALINLHKIVLASNKNGHTIAVTIPECQAKFASLDKARNEVNATLTGFAKNKKDKVLLCDMFSQMPGQKLKPPEAKLLWNDGLHPTPKGYEKMAQIIYGTMKDVLTEMHDEIKKNK